MSIEPLLVERYATKRIGWTCLVLFFYGRYLYEYVEYCHIPPPLPTSHDPMIRQSHLLIPTAAFPQTNVDSDDHRSVIHRLLRSLPLSGDRASALAIGAAEQRLRP